MWLHNKCRSKRRDTEMLPVLILTHQKAADQPIGLTTLRDHKFIEKCLDAVNLCQRCFPCWHPSVSSSPSLCPKVPLTDGDRERRTRGRILQGGFADARSPCVKYSAFYVLLIVNVDSHHPCSKSSAEENISSLIHTSVIHSHGFCLTL